MAADVTRERPETSTVWFVGHWGFQHYCERAGMQPLVPGETLVRAGDFVVIPVYPPGDHFPRPYAGLDASGTEVTHPPEWLADVAAELEWDDLLSAKTVPNLYGGVEPVAGRDHPRLRVRVYRLRTAWVP